MRMLGREVWEKLKLLKRPQSQKSGKKDIRDLHRREFHFWDVGTKVLLSFSLWQTPNCRVYRGTGNTPLLKEFGNSQKEEGKSFSSGTRICVQIWMPRESLLKERPNRKRGILRGKVY